MRDWDGYLGLLHRPWWHRAWVVQEASVENARVWCGRDESSRLAFALVDSILQDHNIQYYTPSGHPDAGPTLGPVSDESKWIHNSWVHLIQHLYRRATDPGIARLFGAIEVLNAVRLHECADPRDRIFAFRSLFPNLRSFEVDYTKSVRDTYISFAHQQLLQGQGEILSACTLDEGYHLPSWVPNWCARKQQPGLFPKYYWDSTEGTRISVYAAASALPDAPFYVRSEVLHIKGVIVDSVRDITQARNRRTDDIIGSEWMEFTRSNTHDVEALANVLCADLQPYAIGTPGAKRGGAAQVLSSLTARNGLDARTFALPSLEAMTLCRVLLHTREGRLGIGPPKTEAGDLICVLCRCPMPFVLRRQGDGYVIVGEVYVHGIMDGEAVTADSEIIEFNIGTLEARQDIDDPIPTKGPADDA